MLKPFDRMFSISRTLKEDDELYIDYMTWRFVNGFKYFLKFEHQQAQKWFALILNRRKTSRLSFFYGGKDYDEKIIAIMRLSSIFYALNSLSFEDVTLNIIENHIEEILDRIQGSDKEEEFQKGRKELLFMTLSLLYQRRCVFTITKVDQAKFQFQKEDLEPVIRNLIIFSTMLADDNPIITRIFDELLTSLILYGDVHIKIIWAFKFLKTYFTLNVNMRCTIEYDYYSQYSMLNILVDNVKSVIDQIAQSEGQYINEILKHELLYSNIPSPLFFVPDPVIISNNHQFISVEFPDQFNIPAHSIAQSNFEKSNEFIKLWMDCFLDWHESLPIDVYEYFSKLNIIIN